MENQTNNNELEQKTEGVETLHAESKVEEVQPEMEVKTVQQAEPIFVENVGEAPQVQQAVKKSKKPLIIGLIIGALVLLCGSIGVGVYAFMNSPEMKMVNAANKIQMMKKAEGTIKVNGSIEIPSFLKTETVEMKMDGTYLISREAGAKEYMNFKGETNFSGSKEFQDMIDMLKLNGTYSAVLTKEMKLAWSGMGQKGTLPLTKDQQKTVQQFLSNEQKEATEDEKAMQEVSAFVIKGYKPVLESSGNKVTVKFDKNELSKVLTISEKNIANDSATFETLYKKAYKNTTDKQVQSIVENAKKGEITRQVEKTMEMFETFQMKMTLDDLGKQVNQNTTIDMTLSPKQAGFTAKVKMNMEIDTTYSL